ncbi:LysR family transcriptional regulator [Amycolatopsis rhabdoformis]|uniref:LysR family transcriptional regulator n=1 Tax=Amycolatopsis rhabdoformis TaxID=1448059 RepID=A0ABZ1INF6_9PSEU|nr:LysR family transcriptional regulator [Amycolatopsis rhabdoformis]WSE35193.1 LysR family transcriptional regulator [Amycolatopsis rhabdoformis]
MDLRSLRFAVTLADELHFKRAADRHYISAQPFGRAIGVLEQELGHRLFLRTTRRVELTTYGEQFITRARKLLADLDELTGGLESAGATAAENHLTLGVFGLGFGERGPSIMRAFRHVSPAVNVEVRELGFSDMDLALKHGEVDVAIVHHTGDVDGLDSAPLMDLSRALIVPRDSEWADLTIVSESDMASMSGLIPLPYASASQATWAGADLHDRVWEGIRTPSAIPTAVATTARPALHVMDGAEFFPHPQVRYVPCAGAPCTMAVAIREQDKRPAVRDFVRVAEAVAGATL